MVIDFMILKKISMNSILRLNSLFVFLLGIIVFPISSSFGQSAKKDLDIQAIKAMSGCFNVEFKYTETFAPEVDYEKAYDYNASALELARVIEESDNKIVLQHLLVIHDTIIIKHWRQDWIYEADRAFTYEKSNHWQFDSIPAGESKGKWTQYVYQVDDSPRYSGTATWTHVDGVSAWFNRTDSPLPRREYSKRSDYNIMNRGNRVQVYKDHWLHEQDNDKIIKTDTSRTLLVQEKGYNTYKKRPMKECDGANKWWDSHITHWTKVRNIWDDFYAKNNTVELQTKVDDKRLYEHLFDDSKEWSEDEIKQLIQTYSTKKTD